MPQKNVVKLFSPDSYYHVYSHGVFSQRVFSDEVDYSAFQQLFKRYLSKEQAFDNVRRPFPHLKTEVELLAYCLMPTHYHLLIYNKSEDGLTKLMTGVNTSYSMSFNKRYKRRGRLFESTYKASLIGSESYLWHISRYIHLNPQDIGQDYTSYPYSSFDYYTGKKYGEWIDPDRILNMHRDGRSDYASFVADYESSRQSLRQIKYMLANS